MKWLMIVMVLFSQAASAGPRTIGNGGGGVVRDGVYMTFGSAGVYVDPEPMPASTIPGLDLIVPTIEDFEINDEQRSLLIQSVIPFGARKYFKVVKEKLDDETYRKLIEEYSKLTRQPPESLTIFAITDPGTRVTYLLPEFFGLERVEQAAILFHEGYWIQKPDASYLEVVSAEIAFQKYVEQKSIGKYEPALAEKLSVLFGSPTITFNMHLKQDFSSGALGELGGSEENGLPLASILPQNAQCMVNKGQISQSREISLQSERLIQNLYALSQKYPASHFLRALLDFLSPDQNGSMGEIRLGLEHEPWRDLYNSRFCFGNIAKQNLRIGRVRTSGKRILFLYFPVFSREKSI